MAPAEESYYGVLDVSPEAAFEEIKKKFTEEARKYHPDKQARASNEALERWHQVQRAWECLSNNTRRLLYDLRVYGKSSLPGGDEKALFELQKQQAEVDIANMQEELQRIMKIVKAKGGILVQKALYGNLRLREDRFSECIAGGKTIVESDLQGPFIDVTQSVQCLVEERRQTIIIPGGVRHSKADLNGFFNPAPLDTNVELELYVRYRYGRNGGMLHEVIVGDRGPLQCPLRRHLVPGGVPRGPYSSSNVTLQLELREKAKAAGRGYEVQDPSSVLHRAIHTYRLAALRVCSIDAKRCGIPTPFEFKLLATCSVMSVAFLAVWAKWCGPKK